jgi:glutaminyl-tRNA synthetase
VATRLRTDFSKLVKWADGKEVTTQWDEGLLKMLGPKDSAENVAANKAGAEKKAEKKGPAEKKSDATKGSTPAASAAPAEEHTLGLVAGMDRFGTPADNKQIDPKLLEEHLKATGGKVVTRFPPEPNGYLHLGHALSMARVFGYAEAKGGYCILRYDDTNPEAEKQEYIDSIANDVKWMGYSPAMVTYASDNFQKLYDFAEQLIRSNHAYVCDLPMEAMREGRRLKQDSPYRNRSVEENLTLFRKMRDGYFKEGFCTLRVKGDMQHDNPNMRDFVAYVFFFFLHGFPH